MTSEQIKQLFEDHSVIVLTTPEEPPKNDMDATPAPTKQTLYRLVPPHQTGYRPTQPSVQPTRRRGCCGKR
jgi:hypothetical protein